MTEVPNISFQPQRGDRSVGCELLDLEELLRQRAWPSDHNPFQPHRVNFFAVLLIETGTVAHEVDFQPVSVKAGECLLISKGQVHAFAREATYQGKLLIFTETFLDRHMAAASLGEVHRLFNHFVGTNRFSSSDLDAVLQLLEQELKGGQPAIPGVLGGLMSVLLLKLAAKKEAGDAGTVEPGIQQTFLRFRNLLLKHLTLSRDASFYAESLGISYKQLNKVCKQAVNETAKAFIHRVVILEAKRQLVSTSLSVKEIAYQLGFDEPTNFVKYFRQHVGHTPRKFRGKNH